MAALALRHLRWRENKQAASAGWRRSARISQHRRNLLAWRKLLWRTGSPKQRSISSGGRNSGIWRYRSRKRGGVAAKKLAPARNGGRQRRRRRRISGNAMYRRRRCHAARSKSGSSRKRSYRGVKWRSKSCAWRRRNGVAAGARATSAGGVTHRRLWLAAFQQNLSARK